MDFLEIMRERKSCRKYDPDKKVSREELLKIVEAGRLTPSRGNLLWWIPRKQKKNFVMPLYWKIM